MMLLSLPEVEVRAWMARSGAKVRLLPSYPHFHRAATGALALPETSRLYWLPNEFSAIADRRPIADAGSFKIFRDEWVGGRRPTVWVYPLPDAPGAPASPEELPFAPPQVQSPVPASKSSVGTRDSRMQREFRASLMDRDGKESCVACGASKPLEAAHIVRHKAPRSLARAAGLRTTWDVRNGVMLCHLCHLHFDNHLWCVGADGKVEVAEALLADTDCEPHFRPMIGKELRHVPGDRDWPAPETWRCQAEQFRAAREKRHKERAEREFECPDCGSLFKAHRFFLHHVEEQGACAARIRLGKKRFWTPAEKRAFPSLAAAEEEAVAVVARRLSLVPESCAGAGAGAGGAGGGPEAGSGLSGEDSEESESDGGGISSDDD
jgi:hypothetical protein